jgi:uncharacterized membrane protein required for colicin V production
MPRDKYATNDRVTSMEHRARRAVSLTLWGSVAPVNEKADFADGRKSGDECHPIFVMSWLKNITDGLGGLPISWVDFLTIIIIGIGVVRGRKRGLSEELLDTTKWILILVAAAFSYKFIGDFMNQKPVLSLLSFYIFSYILVAVVIQVIFLFIKKQFGQKLIESDVFGQAEFYGGMVAGAVRFTCIYFFALSILHAPYYSPEYLEARAKAVDYNYGSDFFPHPCKIQPTVFKQSLTGQGAEKFLTFLLIEPTSED